jgi:hypothetical protein
LFDPCRSTYYLGTGEIGDDLSIVVVEVSSEYKRLVGNRCKVLIMGTDCKRPDVSRGPARAQVRSQTCSESGGLDDRAEPDHTSVGEPALLPYQPANQIKRIGNHEHDTAVIRIECLQSRHHRRSHDLGVLSQQISAATANWH